MEIEAMPHCLCAWGGRNERPFSEVWEYFVINNIEVTSGEADVGPNVAHCLTKRHKIGDRIAKVRDMSHR
jgi:hypothetical protein